MCFAMSEADEILAAHKAAGTVCMVTYMKRYDPAYRYVEPLVRGLRDLQAIEITVLHPSRRTRSAITTSGASRRAGAAARAPPGGPGPADPGSHRRVHAARAAGLRRQLCCRRWSMTSIVLRGLSGDPAEVLFTDVWAGGESMLTVMRYPSGVAPPSPLHYLPDLANYQETVAYYAKADRVKARVPVAVLP